VAVLGPQPLENPLGGVPLLRRRAPVTDQNRIDHRRQRSQLRLLRRFASLITRWNRKIGTSWRSYPGSARTRAPLPAGCAPRAAHTGEPPHRPLLETPLAIPFGLRKGQLLKRPAFAPPPAPMPPRGRLFQRRARFPEGGTERCSPVLYGIYHTPLRLRLNPSRTTIDLPHPMF